MKRKMICLLLVLLLLPIGPILALSDPSLPRVVDNGQLLSPGEEAQLTNTISGLIDTYGMDVVILTVDSLDGSSAQDYADDFYDYCGYGYGDDYSGILLLLAMESRDWWISTCGEAIYAVTDYGIEQLFSEMAGYLSNNQFYAAFDAYLAALPEYFQALQDGDPIDGYAGSYDGPGSYSPGTQDDVVYYVSTGFGDNLLISLLIGLAVAAISLLVMRSKMNTKHPQRSAVDYLLQGSFDLRVQRDMFLYSNVTKTARPKDTDSIGGGGSSTHSGSSGRSHGGGGGKF